MVTQEVEAFIVPDDEGLVRVLLQVQSVEHLVDRPDRPPELPARRRQHQQSSGAGEFHPHALTEPDVNLSAHPAPIVQPPT